VTIELSVEEYKEFVRQVNKLDGIVSGLTEFHDLYVSDLGRLDSLRWRLSELFGLEWDRDSYRYIKSTKGNS